MRLPPSARNCASTSPAPIASSRPTPPPPCSSGPPRDGYKASAEDRSELLAAIEAQAPWLAWEPGAREACLDSDDALDAVLCALLARAAALGLTEPPPASEIRRARVEGWIHLPRRGSLGELLNDHRD